MQESILFPLETVQVTGMISTWTILKSWSRRQSWIVGLISRAANPSFHILFNNGPESKLFGFKPLMLHLSAFLCECFVEQDIQFGKFNPICVTTPDNPG